MRAQSFLTAALFSVLPAVASAQTNATPGASAGAAAQDTNGGTTPAPANSAPTTPAAPTTQGAQGAAAASATATGPSTREAELQRQLEQERLQRERERLEREREEMERARREREERERREREDNGRQIDFLWVQPEAGGSYTDLTALSSMGRLLPMLTQFQGWGLHGGLSLGFRSGWVAIGAQGIITRFGGTATDTITAAGFMASTTRSDQSFDLGQVMLDVHVRFPVPIVEPYVRAGFGYAWLGEFQINEMYRESTSSVHGWTGKIGGGLDLWIGKYFSVGAGLDLGVLNLRRGGVNRMDTACGMDPRCVELRQDGDAVGLLMHLHAQAALHF